MRPGRGEAAALAARDLGDVRAQRAGAARRPRPRVRHDRRRDLDHRLHQLGVHALGELALGHLREHRVDVLHEVPRLRVEQHELLLDAERVRVARAEAVVERRSSASLAVAHRDDRLGLDLDEPARVEQLGRRRRSSPAAPCAKASRCARPTASMSLGARDVDPRADDVVEARAGLAERALDDLEADARLLVGVVGRVGVARHDRRRAGDPDLAARRARRASSRRAPRTRPRRR